MGQRLAFKTNKIYFTKHNISGKDKMFTYLLYCIEILDEGEAVQRYNRHTKDDTLALDLNYPHRTFLPLKVIT